MSLETTHLNSSTAILVVQKKIDGLSSYYVIIETRPDEFVVQTINSGYDTYLIVPFRSFSKLFSEMDKRLFVDVLLSGDCLVDKQDILFAVQSYALSILRNPLREERQSIVRNYLNLKKRIDSLNSFERKKINLRSAHQILDLIYKLYSQPYIDNKYLSHENVFERHLPQSVLALLNASTNENTTEEIVQLAETAVKSNLHLSKMPPSFYYCVGRGHSNDVVDSITQACAEEWAFLKAKCSLFHWTDPRTQIIIFKLRAQSKINNQLYKSLSRINAYLTKYYNRPLLKFPANQHLVLQEKYVVENYFSENSEGEIYDLVDLIRRESISRSFAFGSDLVFSLFIKEVFDNVEPNLKKAILNSLKLHWQTELRQVAKPVSMKSFVVNFNRFKQSTLLSSEYEVPILSKEASQKLTDFVADYVSRLHSLNLGASGLAINHPYTVPSHPTLSKGEQMVADQLAFLIDKFSLHFGIDKYKRYNTLIAFEKY